MTVVSSVNYLAVLVAGLVYFALGAIWYAGAIFGKSWMSLIGKTEEQIKAKFSWLKMVWAFLGSLITAYGVARILSFTPNPSVSGGLMLGLLVGICFIFVIISIGDAMESRPFKLTLINVLYNIIGLLIMGAIIGGWRAV